MFPVLVTNRLLWEPANSEKNLLAAVLCRTHVDPFVDARCGKERHEEWRKLAETMVSLGWFSEGTAKLYSIEECAKLMGKKGERILRAYHDDLGGSNSHLTKTINLKWNETITAMKDVDGVLTMKPRAIVNLDGIFHARMSPLARGIADVLHHVFDGSVRVFCGRPVRIYFASGYTQEELSNIGNSMLDGIFTFAVSGDDSVVSWGGFGRGFTGFGEADQSQFDHTQDEGPQIAAAIWLAALGIPQDFIDYVYHCCSAPYTLRRGRLQASGVAGVQMPTGIALTTILNSISTIFMYLNLMQKEDIYSVKEAGYQLGFKVKEISHPSINYATFLKGWWQWTTEGKLSWMPLPSATIKLGKLLKHPCEIATRVIRGKKIRRSNEEAVAMCALALASSYGHVPPNYPILGAFLEALRRNGKENRKTLRGMEESWKPKSNTIYDIIRSGVEEAIEYRYGLSQNDICRVEMLLSLITKLPAYIEDPVFDALCDVDY